MTTNFKALEKMDCMKCEHASYLDCKFNENTLDDSQPRRYIWHPGPKCPPHTIQKLEADQKRLIEAARELLKQGYFNASIANKMGDIIRELEER